MAVEPASARGSFVHNGVTYYFCAPSCLQRFRADPERYLHAGPTGHHDAPAAPGPGTEYFCPMDPEVVSDRPGSCPKCGMALEPRVLTAEEGRTPAWWTSRRLTVGVLLGVPLMILAMGPMLPAWTGLPWLLAPLAGWNGLLRLLPATPVVFWCGLPFFERAWASVVSRSPNMFTLIALGVGAASSTASRPSSSRGCSRREPAAHGHGTVEGC
jgi:Cu+-exporting ATPase